MDGNEQNNVLQSGNFANLLLQLNQQTIAIISNNLTPVLTKINENLIKISSLSKENNKQNTKIADREDLQKQFEELGVKLTNETDRDKRDKIILERLKLLNRVSLDASEAFKKLDKNEQKRLTQLENLYKTNKRAASLNSLELLNEFNKSKKKEDKDTTLSKLTFNKEGYGKLPGIFFDELKSGYQSLRSKLQRSEQPQDVSQDNKNKPIRVTKFKTNQQSSQPGNNLFDSSFVDSLRGIQSSLDYNNKYIANFYEMWKKKKDEQSQADQLEPAPQKVIIAGYLENGQQKDLPELIKHCCENISNISDYLKKGGFSNNKQEGEPKEQKKSILDRLKGLGSMVLGAIPSILKGTYKLLKGGISIAFKLLKNGLSGIGKLFNRFLIQPLKSLGSKIGGVLTKIGRSIKAFGLKAARYVSRNILRPAGQFISKALSSAKGKIGQIMTKGVSKLGTVGKALSVGGRIISKAALPVSAAIGAYETGKAGVEVYKTSKAVSTDKQAQENLKKMRENNPQLARILDLKEKIAFIKGQSGVQTGRTKEVLKDLETQLINRRAGKIEPTQTTPSNKINKTLEENNKLQEENNDKLINTLENGSIYKVLANIADGIKRLNEKQNSNVNIASMSSPSQNNYNGQSSILLQRALSRT